MTNVSNPYLTVKAVAKKRLATPIALVCAFFGVAVAYSTVELFLRGETGSGVISCFLFAAVMTPVYRTFRHAYRKLSARRIAEALIPLSEESLTFNQLQTVLSSCAILQKSHSTNQNAHRKRIPAESEDRLGKSHGRTVYARGRSRAVGLHELRREKPRPKGRPHALQILRPAARAMTKDSTIKARRPIRRRVWRCLFRRLRYIDFSISLQ